MRHEDLRVGDRVAIRDWDDMAAEFGTVQDSHRGLFIRTHGCFFLEEMKRYCGKVYIVDGFDGGDVLLYREDDVSSRPSSSYAITAEMLRPLPDIVIEFSDADLADFSKLIASGLESKPDRGGGNCEN